MSKKILSMVLAVVMLVGSAFTLTACGNDKKDIKAALICLHGDSSTYDKNFIEAFKQACANKGLSEEDYTIITDIPEGTECYDKAADFADNGYNVIFADSFGHEAYMIKAAKEFPDVQFCHATGTKAHTEGLSNYQNAFASIYQGRYLAGVAAGLKLVELYGDADGKVSDENAKIGYVGAHPYAEVVSGYTSFYLGVKSVVENVTMEVRYTNSWYDETAEKEAANKLITNGCVLISQHADSMGAPSACELAGVPNVSYNGSTVAACPTTFIVSSRINWAPYYKYVIAEVAAGRHPKTDWTGTIKSGSVELSAINNDAAAEGTVAKLTEVRAGIMNGTIKVFDVTKFTVDNGKVLGTDIVDENVVDGQYKESGIYSAPSFAYSVDGITKLNEKF